MMSFTVDLSNSEHSYFKVVCKIDARVGTEVLELTVYWFRTYLKKTGGDYD